MTGTKFLWCDTETTGLDSERDLLLELGFVVTDAALNVIDSASWVIGQSPADLTRMDPYVRDMHAKNGLVTDVVREFEKHGFSIGLVEKQASLFVAHHFAEKMPLFGNTISFDLGFLKKHMPALAAHFHYRTCDVSAFKLPLKEWFSFEAPKGVSEHRVKGDLKNSIAELKAYRDVMMNPALQCGAVKLEEK